MKKLAILVFLVVGFALGFIFRGGGNGDLEERIAESQKKLESAWNDRNTEKAENELWKAIDKLRDADLDAAANNFGRARETLRRALDRLEEANKAAEGNEELRTELQKIRERLESAREDLINLRGDARGKIETALHDLHRLIED